MAELVIRRGLEEPDTSAAFVPHKPQRPEKTLAGKPFELVSISFDRREQDALDYEKLVATLAPSQHRPVALWAGNSAYKASEKRPAQLPSAWLLDKSGKVVESYTGRIPAEAWDRIADLL